MAPPDPEPEPEHEATGPPTDTLVPLPVAHDPRVDGTAIERRLYRALDRLGIAFIPEAFFGRYRVDAYLPGIQVALEADGDAVHCCPECGYDTPEYDAAREHAYRAMRDERLWRIHGVRVIHIWEHDLTNNYVALETVKDVLFPWLRENDR